MKRTFLASPWLGAVFIAALSVSACGTPPPPPVQAGGEGLVSEAPARPPPDTVAPGSAHALVLNAVGCWFGGLWSDAQGASPGERRAAGEKRCMALVERLYGNEDHAKYDQLRLVDAAAVDQIAAEVDRLASRDPVDGAHRDGLLRVLRAAAGAQRENNAAHAAADAVKGDLKGTIEPETLTKDELAAVTPLRAHAALEVLLRLDAGDLRAEAHAMGLLCAMDRMELARGMTKHLKLYTVGDAFQLVFGAAPAPVPSNPAEKLVPGTWLTYLTSVARAAGHAVPDAAAIPRAREPWAWGGVIEGFADKLRADIPSLDKLGPFVRIATAVTKQLDAEWAEIPEIAASQKTIAEHEAKDKKK